MITGMRTPIGKQTGLTIDSTSGGLSLTLPTTPRPLAAYVQVFSAPIRFWVDGSAPTATAGHRADVYEAIELYGAEVANFKAIRETGVSASLEITYYV